MIGILFFMAALSCMAGYASTEVDRTGILVFILKLITGAAIIVVFMKYLTGYGTLGLLSFVTAAVCMLWV